MHESNLHNDFEKFNELIKDIHIAMLTTVAEDGSLRGRPMAAQQIQPDGTLWFLTEKNFTKMDELHSDDRVNIAFVEPKDNKYVSVSGVAHEVLDRKKIHELWNPLYRAWFPEGKDDPNIAALRIDVHNAEFRDTKSNTMVYLLGLAKAALTGRPYEGEGGDHGQISFH